jgi:hypothetical protein
MKNATIFCLTLNPDHEKIIEKLSLVPVGLGNKTFSKNCLSDKEGDSISQKNSFYGEYTFHYWMWKNYLKEIKTEWVGFCQYRKFFIKKDHTFENLDFINLKNIIFNEIKKNEKNFDCILGEKFFTQNIKLSKIVKHHLKYFLLNPSMLFNKKKRNLKFQFDLFHGKKNLEQAIKLLDTDNRSYFREYMDNEKSFNPHNMFICKTHILENYYSTVFPWLEKCEKLFGFDNLNGYGLKRIYGFLAERFLSYWFNKNFKVKELPILFKDLSDYKNL